MKEIENRIGIFCITLELMQNLTLSQLKNIMSNFIIIGCRVIDHNMLEYKAMSELFDEVEEAAIAPTYEIVISKEQEDIVVVKAKRKE